MLAHPMVSQKQDPHVNETRNDRLLHVIFTQPRLPFKQARLSSQAAFYVPTGFLLVALTLSES